MQRGDRALPMERLVGTLLHVRITGSIFHEQEPRRLCASALSFGHRNQYNWQDNGAPELSMPSLIHIATDCCIYIYTGSWNVSASIWALATSIQNFWLVSLDDNHSLLAYTSCDIQPLRPVGSLSFDTLVFSVSSQEWVWVKKSKRRNRCLKTQDPEKDTYSNSSS